MVSSRKSGRFHWFHSLVPLFHSQLGAQASLGAGRQSARQDDGLPGRQRHEDEDEVDEIRERELLQVFNAVKKQIDEVRPAYSHALTSLWLGNAGAALAVLSFIGASLKDGKFSHALLAPLLFFVLGLASMGIGTALFWTRVARYE